MLNPITVAQEENEVDDGHNWSRPPVWTSGDSPIVYQSFDNIYSDFQLKNGAQLVAGKVSILNSTSKAKYVKYLLK